MGGCIGVTNQACEGAEAPGEELERRRLQVRETFLWGPTVCG